MLMSFVTSTQAEKTWLDVDYVGDGIEGHKMDIHVPDDGKDSHKVEYYNKQFREFFLTMGGPEDIAYENCKAMRGRFDQMGA